MSWQAVVLLVGAFGLALVLSLLQHRAYARAVNGVAADEHRDGVVLVTGRAKGVLRGSVVLLVVDRHRHEVVRAQAMQGASVFARFRDRPHLLGPLDGLAGRASSKAQRKAVEDALDRYRRLTAPRRPVRGRV